MTKEVKHHEKNVTEEKTVRESGIKDCPKPTKSSLLAGDKGRLSRIDTIGK